MRVPYPGLALRPRRSMLFVGRGLQTPTGSRGSEDPRLRMRPNGKLVIAGVPLAIALSRAGRSPPLLFVQVVVADVDLSRAGALGATDSALLLQHVHEAGGPRVADAQSPLEERSRDPVVLGH
jgi:hypothetical protein